jgi:plastocyanin
MRGRWPARRGAVLVQFGVPFATLVGVLSCACPSGAASSRTEILDFGYTPGEVVVVPGDAVVWSNNGATEHSVTPDGVSEAFGSGKLPPGKSHVYTFSKLGTYAYHCDVYSSMRGVVRVVDPSSTTTTRTGPARAPFGSATPPSTVAVVPQAPITATSGTTVPAAGARPAQASTPGAPRVPAVGTVPAAPRQARADLSSLPPAPAPQRQAAAAQASPPPSAGAAAEEQADSSATRRTQNRTLALVGEVLFAGGAVLLLSGVRLRKR